MNEAAVDICIVTPRHLGANPRVVKEATSLADAGYRVHIVHGQYDPWHTERDAALTHPAWTLTRVPFGPRLATPVTYARQTLVRHLARQAARVGPLLGTLGPFAHDPVVADLIAATVRVKAALYIAHYDAALPAAARAACQHGALYAFDAEDFHPGDLPDTAQYSAANRIIHAIEQRTLPGAAFLTAASPGIADAYAQRYAIARPQVVLNAFSRREAPASPTPAGTARPGPSVYWFSQTIGPDRGLECAVRAIAIARTRPHLYLRGAASASFANTLQTLASTCGVAERVHLLAPGTPKCMARLASEYDLGLVGETGATLNRRIALTNKQFTYILAGVPALMSDIDAHAAFAAEAEGAAFLYKTDDPADLAARLDTLLGNPVRLAEARRTAFRLGQERFNWERESVALVERVSQVMSQTGSNVAA